MTELPNPAQQVLIDTYEDGCFKEQLTGMSMAHIRQILPSIGSPLFVMLFKLLDTENGCSTAQEASKLVDNVRHHVVALNYHLVCKLDFGPKEKQSW